MTGKVVILSGPSGVGKDTVIDAWKEANPNVERVVAYTTRKPRPGEEDGIAYHFVSREEFDRKAANGDFLEFKEVHGNGYATPLTDLRQMLEQGKVAILKIDVQGALTAMDVLPEAVTVFLMPPSTDELRRRMHQRGTEDATAMETRLRNALGEIELSKHYAHLVVNEDVAQVVATLAEIVR